MPPSTRKTRRIEGQVYSERLAAILSYLKALEKVVGMPIGGDMGTLSRMLPRPPFLAGPDCQIVIGKRPGQVPYAVIEKALKVIGGELGKITNAIKKDGL